MPDDDAFSQEISPGDSSFGNRMRSVATALLLAVATDRALLIRSHRTIFPSFRDIFATESFEVMYLSNPFESERAACECVAWYDGHSRLLTFALSSGGWRKSIKLAGSLQAQPATRNSSI